MTSTSQRDLTFTAGTRWTVCLETVTMDGPGRKTRFYVFLEALDATSDPG